MGVGEEVLDPEGGVVGDREDVFGGPGGEEEAEGEEHESIIKN